MAEYMHKIVWRVRVCAFFVGQWFDKSPLLLLLIYLWAEANTKRAPLDWMKDRKIDFRVQSCKYDNYTVRSCPLFDG